MHEKHVFIVCLICLLLFNFSSCCTRAAVYGDGDGAYTVREYIGELKDKQTESAVTGERLNGALESAREKSKELNREITAGREHSEHLKQSITDGAGEFDVFDRILQQIRERYVRNNSGKASPN